MASFQEGIGAEVIFTEEERPSNFFAKLPEELQNGDIIFDELGEPWRVVHEEMIKTEERVTSVPVCQLIAESNGYGTKLVRCGKINYIRPLETNVLVKAYYPEDLIIIIEHQMTDFLNRNNP